MFVGAQNPSEKTCQQVTCLRPLRRRGRRPGQEGNSMLALLLNSEPSEWKQQTGRSYEFCPYSGCLLPLSSK